MCLEGSGKKKPDNLYMHSLCFHRFAVICNISRLAWKQGNICLNDSFRHFLYKYGFNIQIFEE